MGCCFFVGSGQAVRPLPQVRAAVSISSSDTTRTASSAYIQKNYNYDNNRKIIYNNEQLLIHLIYSSAWGLSKFVCSCCVSYSCHFEGMLSYAGIICVLIALATELRTKIYNLRFSPLTV